MSILARNPYCDWGVEDYGEAAALQSDDWCCIWSWTESIGHEVYIGPIDDPLFVYVDLPANDNGGHWRPAA